MNPTTVKLIAELKGLNQSDLARMVGITRQCVSLWFSHTSNASINIETKNLRKLADALRVDIKEIIAPLPCTDNPDLLQREETKLNWDLLYPDVLCLATAAARGELVAVARFVQEYGFFTSAKLMGKRIWSMFPEYKRFIKPVRRNELEQVWELVQSRKTA